MSSTPIDVAGTTARVSVNLDALKANYLTLRKLAKSAVCAGVVKANAYGLGLEPVAKALWAAGCRVYFVALLSEAADLRALFPDAEIYVMDGLMKGAAADYRQHNVRPVLASIEEAEEWSQFCRDHENRLPAAVHVDTGINRLGIDYDEALVWFKAGSGYQDFDLCMVMSHLACADDRYHPLNGEQVRKFDALRGPAPKVPFSLANSAATLSRPNAHFDLVRPGIALYGSNPMAVSDVPIQPVVTLEAAVLQVRNVKSGQSIGYSATFTCERASKIAVLGLGYADGFFRNLGGFNDRYKAHVYISGHMAPVIGRVSMDMICVDVTDLPPGTVVRGTMVEVIGENISLDGVAQASETISYEVLTRLGNRFERVYLTLEASE